MKRKITEYVLRKNEDNLTEIQYSIIQFTERLQYCVKEAGGPFCHLIKKKNRVNPSVV